MFADNISEIEDESITKRSTLLALYDPYRSVHVESGPRPNSEDPHNITSTSTSDTLGNDLETVEEKTALPRNPPKLRAEAAEFVPRTSSRKPWCFSELQVSI